MSHLSEVSLLTYQKSYLSGLPVIESILYLQIEMKNVSSNDISYTQQHW